ncbi:DNA polymerase, palm domain [Cinara cedri]|uniref:DNA polymerase, palm domain n=1 Tax=Cinara cedri TaxID=506608 RepID=A0A5E4MB79_9HEMI|nr:DNA polymerase, palm domain [Cinara cedri]
MSPTADAKVDKYNCVLASVTISSNNLNHPALSYTPSSSISVATPAIPPQAGPSTVSSTSTVSWTTDEENDELFMEIEMYVYDGNNLYGWAMSQYMPHDGFQWKESTLDGLEDLTDTSDIGRANRVLEFKQSPWLAKYISLNTEMRKKAVNDFKIDFYKLMNNAVFGNFLDGINLTEDRH